MAMSNALPLIFFLVFLLLHSVHSDETMVNSNASGNYLPQKLACGPSCAARCRLSGRRKMCLRACGTCCARCNCVPPGTSGNTEVCPCYANMTTHGGRKKCP